MSRRKHRDEPRRAVVRVSSDSGDHSHATMGAGRPGGVKRRAVARLTMRVHGKSEHSEARCGCKLWEPVNGFRQPGSTSGRK